MPKSKRNKDSNYDVIAQQLLTLMGSGTVPWRRSWSTTPYCNAISGRQYSGVNPLLAALDILEKGYSNTLFVGFKQAKNIGWQVKKGSKSTGLSLCKRVCKEKTDSETGQTKEEFYTYRSWRKVFNLDCIDDTASETKVEDIIAKYSGDPNTSPRIEDAEKLIAAQKAEIGYGGNRACYSPSRDKIIVPMYESFSAAEAYYATLIHELIHRTGHVSRLSRDLSGNKGDSTYAFEELVADMGSAFVCGTLGIRSDLENHASYLAYWMDIIRNDNKAFFKAFSFAKEAADLLLSNAGMLTATESDVEAA